MKLLDPTLVERLAAEYVVGVMRGAARARFARIAQTHALASRAIAAWEQRLLPLAIGLAPVAPPAHVWRTVTAQIARARPSRAARDPAAFRWRLAAIGLGAALALSWLWMIGQPTAPSVRVDRTDRIALIGSANDPAWLLEFDDETGSVRARAVSAPDVQPGQSLELWLMPGQSDGVPLSAGLLPSTGTAKIELSADARALLQTSQLVAVSLEPLGGSPTGAPTGPVLFTAALVRAPSDT